MLNRVIVHKSATQQLMQKDFKAGFIEKLFKP